MWNTTVHTVVLAVIGFVMRVIDLYCGLGGFSAGAIEAGAEVILGVDNVRAAACARSSLHSTSCERLT